MLNVFSQLTAGTRFNKKKNKDAIELFKGKGIDDDDDDNDVNGDDNDNNDVNGGYDELCS